MRAHVGTFGHAGAARDQRRDNQPETARAGRAGRLFPETRRDGRSHHQSSVPGRAQPAARKRRNKSSARGDERKQRRGEKCRRCSAAGDRRFGVGRADEQRVSIQSLTAQMPTLRSGPGPKSLLIALAYAGFISLGMPDGLLGVAWPSMRASFGLPVNALGLLLVFSTTGYLLSSVSSGWLLARMNVGGLLAVSC